MAEKGSCRSGRKKQQKSDKILPETGGEAPRGQEKPVGREGLGLVPPPLNMSLGSSRAVV